MIFTLVLLCGNLDKVEESFGSLYKRSYFMMKDVQKRSPPVSKSGWILDKITRFEKRSLANTNIS